MKLETREVGFEVRSLGDPEGFDFSGIANGACSIDSWGTTVAPRGFDRDLEYFRTQGVIRDEHQVTTGRVAEASVSGFLLNFRGIISKTTAGRDQALLLKDGVYRRVSIGFMPFPKDRMWLEGRDAIDDWWRECGYSPDEIDLKRAERGHLLVFTRVRPVEVSTVYAGANEAAVVTQVRGAPRTGVRLSQHAEGLLADLEALAERAEQARDRRAAEGRPLGAETMDRIARLEQRLRSLREDAGPDSGPIEDDGGTAEVAVLQARFALLCNEIDHRRID